MKFLCIHRLPSNNVKDFIIELDDYLSLETSKDFLIICDININLLKLLETDTSKYLTLLNASGLTSLINKHTRITPYSQTCIDDAF